MPPARNKITYQLFSSLSDLDTNEWTTFHQSMATHDFMDVRFLAAVERSMSSQCQLFYVIFYDQEHIPVGCAVLSLFQLDLLNLRNRVSKKLAQLTRTLFPNFFRVPLLLCGVPVSIGQNFLVLTPEADEGQIIPLLERAFNQVSQQKKSKVTLLTELQPEDCKRLDPFLPSDYSKAEVPPMFSFDPIFADFQQYTAALKAKYRGNINRAKRNFRESGFQITHARDHEMILSLFTPQLYRLYKYVVQKSKHRFEVLPIEFFHEIIKNFRGQILLSIAERDVYKAGFIISLITKKKFYFLFLGLDYQINLESNIYYNLFYEVLEQAFQSDVKSIQIGQTADTFKSRLGCISTPMHLYLKSNTPFFKFLLNILDKDLLPELEENQTYNVFK